MAGEPLNFENLSRQAQEFRERLVLARTELAETEVTGSADGGLVKVTMNGDGEVMRVVFDQAAVDEGDAESLAASTLIAFRNATDTLKSLAAERLAGLSAIIEAAAGTDVASF